MNFENYDNYVDPKFLSNPSNDIANTFIENYSNNNDDQTLYNKLLNNWDEIFSDGNRNAGGAQFFHYIINKMNPTEQEFDKYNQFYCGVSGSVVEPGSSPQEIRVKDINGNYVCGDYYLCCWPCACDVAKYTIAENVEFRLKNATVKKTVLTMNDPCKYPEQIPEEVTSFQCNNRETQNAYRTNSGRIVVAVLHNSRQCLDNFTEDPKCEKRNQGDLTGGMSDIFVNLAKQKEINLANIGR